jgi:NAD(P)-dependent dehydrogenase (short-subunit alcohol dehydrogenase family)
MKDGGCIIINSSVTGILGVAGSRASVTSKQGVVGITRATTIEAAPRKIRVNTAPIASK